MESIHTASALEKNSLIVSALADFPKGVIETNTLKKELPVGLEEINQANMVQRESGDQINRFLLFALVSNSAKRIKARAANKGVDLPMTLITRSVLRSYRAAAKVKNGPFAISTPDPQQLEELNKEIFLNLISQWKKALRPPAKPR